MSPVIPIDRTRRVLRLNSVRDIKIGTKLAIGQPKKWFHWFIKQHNEVYIVTRVEPMFNEVTVRLLETYDAN